MKKLFIYVVLFAVVGMTGIWADEPPTVQQPEVKQPEVKDFAAFQSVVMVCIGSYTQIQGKISEFIKTFFEQGLVPSGDLMGIYYNDPKVTKEADLKWAIGFPVAAGSTVKEPLQALEFKAAKCVYYMHIGPYDKAGESYAKVNRFIEENGYKIIGPYYECYINDPSEVKPEELQTDIIVPVEKK